MSVYAAVAFFVVAKDAANICSDKPRFTVNVYDTNLGYATNGEGI